MRFIYRFLSKTNRPWLFALAYILVLFIGSVMPVGSGTQDILMNNYTLSIRWDYLVHLAIYIPLPSLMFIGFRPSGLWRVFGMVLLILTIPALFEFAQMPIPYRFFNINDLVANEVGVVLGLGIYLGLVVHFRSAF